MTTNSKKRSQAKPEGPPLPPIEEHHFSSYREFYDSIPIEGSLGILALGAMGLMAWREKKAAVEKEKKGKEESNLE